MCGVCVVGRGEQWRNYNMERPRGVNCVKTVGGRTLCSLHRAEELYGLARYRGYMIDSWIRNLTR